MINSFELLESWSGLRKVGVAWGAHLLANVRGFQQFCSVSQDLELVYVSKSDVRPSKFSEIDALKITSHLLPDGVHWQTQFVLKDSGFEQEFAELCADLANSVTHAPNASAAQTLFSSAYETWISFFKKSRGFTLEAARGLFAELLYLSEEVAPKFGWPQALDSWHGPLGGAQDFIIPGNLAVEVKSIQPSSSQVVISSENQMSFNGRLYLRVYRILDHTSTGQPGETLVSLVNSIQEILDVIGKQKFRLLLAKVSYDPESPFSVERLFELTQVQTFLANGEGFPKISKEMLNPAITNVTYKLGLPFISEYEVDSIEF